MIKTCILDISKMQMFYNQDSWNLDHGETTDDRCRVFDYELKTLDKWYFGDWDDDDDDEDGWHNASAICAN